MFDIGFWEIALISVIGLIVLGPERLPTAIRSVMQWVNSAKGIANSVKSEISQELKLHELNEMNDKMIKASKQGFTELDDELQASIDKMKQDARDVAHPYQPKDQQPPSQSQTQATPAQDKKIDEPQ